MINADYATLESLYLPIRTIKGKVECYERSTAPAAINVNADDNLKSIEITKEHEQGKFFGFGISQKAVIEILGRGFELGAADTFRVSFNAHSKQPYYSTLPPFFLDNVTKDEVTGDLKITAYDVLYSASAHTVEELELVAPFSLLTVIEACAALIGASGVNIDGVYDGAFRLGTTFSIINANENYSIRALLDAIAEVSQTIYFIDVNNNLTFKSLNSKMGYSFSIDKAKYFELKKEETITLSNLAHITELGENYEMGTGEGATQYLRENPFLEPLAGAKIGTLFEEGLDALQATNNAITPYNIKWRGSFLLEIGDCIEIIQKDDTAITAFYLNDTINYNGAFTSSMQYTYQEQEKENTVATTLGEALNLTRARVDKVNKKIELLAAEVKESGDYYETLIEQIPEEVKITVKQELKEEGAEKVITNTGYTFDEEGLTIEKSGSDIKTTISEDGMQVFKQEEEVLTANNEGVKATDLHARTYIWIGANSRLEDYGYGRTGCFYVGG